MKLTKKYLSKPSYGVASIFGIIGAIILLPGGILIALAILFAEVGDRLESGPYDEDM
jgi:hypothetical protein